MEKRSSKGSEEGLIILKNQSLDSSKLPHQNLPRKCKRRSSRRSNTLDAWASSQQNGDLVSDMEYNQPRMLWQSNMPHNVHGNGQRLFTAMSDPSVCGYSAMPVTYTMQPVPVPPMYRLFQTVPLPDVRTVHSKNRADRKRHMTNFPNANNNIANGSNSQQENGTESSVHITYQNGDYTSLPPTADSGINGDELNSEHRRYSDPGLGPAKPLVYSDSEDSIDSGSSITTINRSNKLILSLIEQMTDLKKYNSQLFKELNVTKSYVENMTAKLMQCKHCTSSDYQPGMLSDLIREIREANKKCEEGLFTKMKTMLDERFSQQRKEIEEYKSQLSKVMKDKEESEKRVARLEEELAALKLTITNEGREITAFEEETLALRRELQEARASRTLAENHAAKLEKLVEILRKKVNGATAVNRIRDALAAGASCNIPASPAKGSSDRAPPSSASSSSGNEERSLAKKDVGGDGKEDEDDEDDNNDDDDDDGNIDGGSHPAASRSDKNPPIANDLKTPPTLDNGINLSGPVTDL